jgi:hypothetical protein
VNPEYRDGLLALAGLTGLTGLTVATVGVSPLFDPSGIVAGVTVAVLVEAVFLQYPEWALDIWERPGVPVVGLCTVLAAGVVGVWLAPRLLVVPVWGLVTYLVLLGCVLVGVRNPVGALLQNEESEQERGNR